MQPSGYTGGIGGGGGEDTPWPWPWPWLTLRPQYLVAGGARRRVCYRVLVHAWLLLKGRLVCRFGPVRHPPLSLAQPIVCGVQFTPSPALEPAVPSTSLAHLVQTAGALGGWGLQASFHLLIRGWQQCGARVLEGVCPGPVGRGDNPLHPVGQCR